MVIQHHKESSVQTAMKFWYVVLLNLVNHVGVQTIQTSCQLMPEITAYVKHALALPYRRNCNKHNFYTEITEGIVCKHMTTNRFTKLLTISVDNSVHNVLCDSLTT